MLVPALWIHGGPLPVALLLGGGIMYTVGAIGFGQKWPTLAPEHVLVPRGVARLHGGRRRAAFRRDVGGGGMSDVTTIKARPPTNPITATR